MPIREKRGKWQIRFRVDGHTYYETTDLDATERNRTAAMRLEAKARELVLQGRGAELKIRAVPFNRAAEAYLTWADGEYRAHPNSALRIRTSFASIVAHFGKLPVSSITPGMIEDFKGWRRTEHEVREVTIRHDLHALSGFIRYAQKQNWIRGNPLEDVEIPSDADAIRMHILTAKEEALYFETARRNQNLYDLGRIILLQGCRPDVEVLALRKEHVDLERGTFRIVNSKTPAGRRTLTMVAEVREILARRMAGVSPWIFPSPKMDGHIIKLNKAHDAVLEDTGLAFVLYDLRHTFATRAAEGGMPVATLAAILGHGNLRSVSKYVHVRQEAMDSAMRELDARATYGPVTDRDRRDSKGTRVN